MAQPVGIYKETIAFHDELLWMKKRAAVKLFDIVSILEVPGLEGKVFIVKTFHPENAVKKVFGKIVPFLKKKPGES